MQKNSTTESKHNLKTLDPTRVEYTFFQVPTEYRQRQNMSYVIKQNLTNLKELNSYRVVFLSLMESNEKSVTDNRTISKHLETKKHF